MLVPLASIKDKKDGNNDNTELILSNVDINDTDNYTTMKPVVVPFSNTKNKTYNNITQQYFTY